QSIWALRSHDAGEQTLPIRLRRLVEQAGGGDLTAKLEGHGAYRTLTPEGERGVLRVAQEGIHNVKKHAQASSLSVGLDYDARELKLTVRDDGKGIAADSSMVNGAAGAGHYGVTGMRERAELIGAEIGIESEPGKGTCVMLRVPAPV